MNDPSNHVVVGPHTTEAFMPFCNYTFVDETYDSQYGEYVDAFDVESKQNMQILFQTKFQDGVLDFGMPIFSGIMWLNLIANSIRT